MVAPDHRMTPDTVVAMAKTYGLHISQQRDTPSGRRNYSVWHNGSRVFSTSSFNNLNYWLAGWRTHHGTQDVG